MKHDRVVVDPAIMVGKPLIRGTRIPVELILRRLRAGASPEEVMEDYPQITPADIRAAQAFTADYLAGEEIIATE